jgi:hypothetical protein
LKLGVYLNSQHPESDDPVRRLAETIEALDALGDTPYFAL